MNYNYDNTEEQPEQDSGSMIQNLVEQVVEDYLACKVQLMAKCEEMKKLKSEMGKEDDESYDLSAKLEEALAYKQEVMQTFMQIMSSGM
jgi:hypothetical protein